MEAISCPECGIVFGCPPAFITARRADKRDFFCPNKHPMSFHKSKADQLAEELSRAKQQIAQKDEALAAARRMREHAERSLSAQIGVNTKLRKRVGNGTCPCCNRTFKQLAAHMKEKHPEFKAEAVA